MRQKVWYSIIFIIFVVAPMSFANEFVVAKKTKAKKESCVHVKEDIVELLESALRQLGSNIQQSVIVQNQIFDKIKEILGDSQQSTSQLKDLREKLEKYLKKIEEQQADLQSFLLACK
jgi:uncharacterized protein YpbB